MSHIKVPLEMATVNPRGQNEQPKPPEPLPHPSPGCPDETAKARSSGRVPESDPMRAPGAAL